MARCRRVGCRRNRALGGLLRSGDGLVRLRPALGPRRRDFPLKGLEQLDEQVDEARQESPEPIPAAVRGQILRNPAECLGEPLRGSLEGRGGTHSAWLVFLTHRVKRDFVGNATNGGGADGFATSGRETVDPDGLPTPNRRGMAGGRRKPDRPSLAGRCLAGGDQ
jgi:hypothetical protein